MTNTCTRLARFLVLALALLGMAAMGLASGPETQVISLADADLTFIGDVGAWDAYSASPAGDLNGDGYDDLVIGSPMAWYGLHVPGRAYLALGRPRGDWSPDHIPLSEVDASFVGCLEAGMTGRQNYTAGDVNGDGFDDLLIGAPHNARGGDNAGAAYLCTGTQVAGHHLRAADQAGHDSGFVALGTWTLLP